MTAIIIIIAIYIAYCFIHEWIENNKEKEKIRIKENIAKEILKDFNFDKEKNEILSISKGLSDEYKKCPNCYGFLIIRNSKYGQFLGCSNYPKCKFIQNIK